MPVGVIILAAAHVPDVVDHPGGPIRYMLDQPFMEQILDLVGQAQQHIARTGRAMIGGGFQQVFDLMIIEAGNDWRSHYGYFNTCVAEGADRVQSTLRRGGARLHLA